MSSHAEQRIHNAVDSLIAHLVPHDTSEDEKTAQEHHDSCFKLVTSILQHPPPSATATSDVNHASDLIRRKLLQRNPTDAQRYSNLYTRLLSLPVLNQKWAMLFLLYQLSDLNDSIESPASTNPFNQPLQPPSHKQVLQAQTQHAQQNPQLQPPHSIHRESSRGRRTDRERAPNPVVGHARRAEEEAFREAFAPEGLKKYPQPPGKPREAGKPPPPTDSASTPGQKPSSAPSSSATAVPAPPPRDVSIKSTMLSDRFVTSDPSELSLLRDLPYTLQGLSSTTLPFENDGSLNLPNTLPVPITSLLNTLAEPSLLFRKLSEWVKTPAIGLLHQSLRAAIDGELRSYLSLVATLEAQIRKALSSIDDKAPRSGIGKAGVTLKRCIVWTREATMGLRLMSVIAEESTNKKGGQLISLIHSFSTLHGDPTVGAFAERLLSQVTRPFYDILRHWIYDGELSDPYEEFFVKEKPETPTDSKAPPKQGGSSVWDSKYEIELDMIPSILTQEFAEKVFLIGKSLNFIRHSCGDATWVENYSATAAISKAELRYGEGSSLLAFVNDAHDTTQRRLMHLMDSRFHVFQHLRALKDYMLLGQGDFIALLMESLAANLDRPAGEQYRHTLTAQLEHAIRGSNAQYDSPKVLRRLDARMLQLSHGEIGWDCFTLEYKIDAPVDVVVTDWGNRQYLKVFNFLWRVKRVEFALASTWRKCMTGARGVLQGGGDEIERTWKLTRGVLAEMVHFVGQLQYYILFEVIEASWTELQQNVRREGCTLDDLIKAHTKYLTLITHKGLLGAKKRRGGDDQSASGDETHSYRAQLGELLKLMLLFRDSVDGLYSWSVSDFTRRQEADVRSTTSRANKPMQGGPPQNGTNGYNSTNLPVHSEFPELQRVLRQLGITFRSKLQLLLGDLATQTDADMKFLGTAMNFNDVYQLVVRKKSNCFRC